MNERGWIGVDLDGTLAHYDHWVDDVVIGAPIKQMVDRVKVWLDKGLEVRVFTARAFGLHTGEPLFHVIEAINKWCEEHIGAVLPVTNRKDMLMIELWDDRCVSVEPNTGNYVTFIKGRL